MESKILHHFILIDDKMLKKKFERKKSITKSVVRHFLNCASEFPRQDLVQVPRASPCCSRHFLLLKYLEKRCEKGAGLVKKSRVVKVVDGLF